MSTRLIFASSVLLFVQQELALRSSYLVGVYCTPAGPVLPGRSAAADCCQMSFKNTSAHDMVSRVETAPAVIFETANKDVKTLSLRRLLSPVNI